MYKFIIKLLYNLTDIYAEKANSVQLIIQTGLKFIISDSPKHENKANRSSKASKELKDKMFEHIWQYANKTIKYASVY